MLVEIKGRSLEEGHHCDDAISPINGLSLDKTHAELYEYHCSELILYSDTGYVTGNFPSCVV